MYVNYIGCYHHLFFPPHRGFGYTGVQLTIIFKEPFLLFVVCGNYHLEGDGEENEAIGSLITQEQRNYFKIGFLDLDVPCQSKF